MTALRFGAATALAVATCSLSATAQVQFQNQLMPQPAAMSIGSAGLSLDSTFAVEVPGVSDGRLTSAINREFSATVRDTI